jgi:hypothetical protein
MKTHELISLVFLNLSYTAPLLYGVYTRDIGMILVAFPVAAIAGMITASTL